MSVCQELYIYGSNPPPVPRAHADYTYMATECDGPGGANWMNIAEIDYVLWSRRPNFTASMIEEKLAWMAPTVAWLEQQGFLNQSYCYGFDEAGPEYSLAIRQLFGAVKTRWPGLRTMAVLNWNGSTDHLVEEVGSVVDVWVEDYRTYNESLVTAWMASSPTHEYWTYWCCCYKLEVCLNNFVEWPAIHNRLFTWLSAYRNATGLLYYETDRWFGGNEKAHANDSKLTIQFLNESSGNHVWPLLSATLELDLPLLTHSCRRV